MEKLTLKEYEVPMSDEAFAELKRISSITFLSKESLRPIWEVVPLGAAMFASILVVVWLLLNWLIGLISSLDFGWNSDSRNYILWPIVGFSYLYFFVVVAKSCRPSTKTREALKKDLAERIVKVSEYPITGVKIFEEPEHGGYIYFVRTFDNKVMALFDSESQDLSIDDKDPSDSSYKIREKLKITRAPNANIIVDEQFYGDIVTTPEIKVFTANTEAWPEHAEFVKCKWEHIDAKYGVKKCKSKRRSEPA